jgi:GrpB-like predicted nucleotidyltransferase (UPF0157 family)
VDHAPEWRHRFECEAKRILSVLGDRALHVEVVGSTSVPELPAKPVIDIELGVTDSAQENEYAGALESAGYKLHIRDPGWYEHRMFRVRRRM